MHGPRGELGVQYARGINSIVQQLSADVTENEAARKAVKKVMRTLKQIPGLTVSRCHQGGSFGRRTMVPDHFDVDTIIYVEAFDHRPLRYPDDWQDQVLMLNMRRQVALWLRANTMWDITLPEDAHYRYVLQLDVGRVKFDLLLVPDCLTGGSDEPSWSQHVRLMAPVYAAPESSTYVQLRERADSAALTEFLKAQNDDVKGVVRLVKAWYKLGVCGGTEPASRVGSVALEVLVLAAAERLAQKRRKALRAMRRRLPDGSRSHATPRGNAAKLQLFAATLRLIRKVVVRGSVAMVDAGKWGYGRLLGMYCALNWAWDEVKIIHPNDPTCNLARAQCHKAPTDWRGLAREARKLLRIMRTGTYEDLLGKSTLGRAFAHAKLARLQKLVAPPTPGLVRPSKQQRKQRAMSHV